MMHHSSGGGRAAWASNDDYIAIGCAIVLIGLGFFAYQAWITYHAEISWGVFYLQHWKMQLIAHFTDQYAQQDASVLAAWTAIYREPDRYFDLYELGEELVDLEEAFRLWRFRHVTTVERIIGFKRGTGGTAGVSYLRKMLDTVLFPELWRLRTEL